LDVPIEELMGYSVFPTLAGPEFGSGWLWPGLGFSRAKAKPSLKSLPKTMA
jgi:hypothetical protein